MAGVVCCRPYFTYWATFVQLVVFIVAVAVYGTAPFGIGKHTESKMVSCLGHSLLHSYHDSAQFVHHSFCL
jgi:hypothetical protein